MLSLDCQGKKEHGGIPFYPEARLIILHGEDITLMRSTIFYWIQWLLNFSPFRLDEKEMAKGN
ncbi:MULTISPECIES: hypothetical protein [unclassified Legionella]|uniref:hypothetical protein n=1 Tax=unclassified Legionella TaxID=2622702 RepID=UPI001E2FFC72|nr:hypothetical protein [Legionella sp. 31fI33]MCC5014711.1 hypothetical protein [Legionella sp. 31fI33]